MNDLDRLDLVPRPELVEALLRDEARVVVIAGESGAGKSTLLKDAVAAAQSERLVAPIHEITWTDLLLAVVLDALGAVVAQIVEDQGALERLGDRLSGAIERLIESRGRDLATAAGIDILRFARARLGPEAGQ